MATYTYDLKISSSWYMFDTSIPLYIYNGDNLWQGNESYSYKIKSIKLGASKVLNTNGSFYNNSGKLIEKGTLSTNNNSAITISYNNFETSLQNVSNSAVEMRSANPSITPWTSVDAYAPLGDTPTYYNFNDLNYNIPYNYNTQQNYINIKIYNLDVVYPYGCLSFYLNHGGLVGQITIEETQSTDLTNLYIEGGNNILLTNTSTVANVHGKLKDSSTMFKIIPNNGGTITSILYDNLSQLIGLKQVTSDFVFNAYATKDNTDYLSYPIIIPMRDSKTNVSVDAIINFYKIPQTTNNFKSPIKFNIKNIDNVLNNYTITKNNKSNTKQIKGVLLVDGDNYVNETLLQDYNNNFDSDSDNNSTITIDFSKILHFNNKDNILTSSQIPYRLNWRYYNNIVQTVDSNYTYKNDNTLNLIFYVVPNIVDNLSIELSKTTSENIVYIYDALKDKFVNKDLNLPYIDNISYNYTNNPEDGFCRVFGVNLYTNTDSLNVYYTATVDNSKSSITNISDKTSIKNWLLSKTGETITLTTNTYFYYGPTKTAESTFNPNSENISNFTKGVTRRLKNNIQVVNLSDLYPQVYFPLTDNIHDFILPDIERIGYTFSDTILNFVDNFKIEISDINTKEILDTVDFKGNNEYFSNTNFNTNIVFNSGKYILSKYNILKNRQVSFTAYITLYENTEYNYTIKALNSVKYDTTASPWYRPIAKQGEYVQFYDYDNFINVINKYLPLMYNIEKPEWENQNSGNTITVKYWGDIVDKLTQMSKNMQNWAQPVSKLENIWWNYPYTSFKSGSLFLADNNVLDLNNPRPKINLYSYNQDSIVYDNEQLNLIFEPNTSYDIIYKVKCFKSITENIENATIKNFDVGLRFVSLDTPRTTIDLDKKLDRLLAQDEEVTVISSFTTPSELSNYNLQITTQYVSIDNKLYFATLGLRNIQIQKAGNEPIVNNNKANFYDLLIQLQQLSNNGSSPYATHNYLKDKKYTHNYLNNHDDKYYTHNDITNKEGF